MLWQVSRFTSFSILISFFFFFFFFFFSYPYTTLLTNSFSSSIRLASDPISFLWLFVSSLIILVSFLVYRSFSSFSFLLLFHDFLTLATLILCDPRCISTCTLHASLGRSSRCASVIQLLLYFLSPFAV